MLAVIRLLDLKVDPPLIAETVSAILDQRLIRKICPECGPRCVDPESSEPPGCGFCAGTGYYGRTGLFRLLEFDDTIRSAIRSRDAETLKKLSRERAGTWLQKQAEELIRSRQTTRMESKRVLKED